ncbi:uncharacterized protein NPIL_499611 [Nephila pilipes]|uniref:Uncharacterized protein n=1 Tax=Nephila pilipes TaxID=299642 RepID=A0A8X6Q5P0_NEPPI|nr:uncharacterized protein NPIL_499611 [Nephila pilipes]
MLTVMHQDMSKAQEVLKLNDSSLKRLMKEIKNVKTGNGPLTVAGLTKLIHQFEEKESLEDCVKSGQPHLRQTRSALVTAEMETLASESAAGTSSALEAVRRLGLPPSSIRNILHGVHNQCPYRLQSCYELLLSDTVEREAFASPSNLSELKDEICLELSCIKLDILHSVVAGFMTLLQCVDVPCDSGHVEHILL